MAKRSKSKTRKTKVEVWCERCGRNIVVQSGSDPVCRGRCYYKVEQKNCKDCGRTFRPRGGSSSENCGEYCSANYVFFKCNNCNKTVKRPKKFGAGHFCDDLCRIEWDSRIVGYEFSRRDYLRVRYSAIRKRRLREGDLIDRMDLFQHYNWICSICDERIDPELRTPHPMAATVDHIVPLAAGGRHTWDNVAPAHLCCNQAKGARTERDTA